MITHEVNLLESQAAALMSENLYTAFVGGVGCIHDSALIETIEGLKHPSEIKKPTKYKTFNGLYYKFNQGTVPRLKGAGDLYRVIHEQGEFVAFSRHLTFFYDHKYLSLANVYERFQANTSLHIPLVTNLEYNALAPFLNVRRSLQSIQDSLDDYLMCIRFCDAPLHEVINIDREMFPSLNDVLKFYLFFYSHIREHKDDFLVQEQDNIHHENNAYHVSKKDFLNLLEGRLLNAVNLITSFDAEYIFYEYQLSFLCRLRILTHRIMKLFYRHHITCNPFLAYVSSNKKLYNSITHIEKIGQGEYWDLTVENTHNYIANGAIHHNSGKTRCGAHLVIKMCQDNHGSLGFIGANTYKQLRDSTLESLFSEFDRLCIPYTYKEARSILYMMGQKILCRSMDSFDFLRGLELGWAYVDEVRDLQEMAHKVLIGRLRDKRAKNKKLLYTTTPCGFNWLKDYFAGKKKTSKYGMINARTKDNYYLEPDYADTLAESYDKLLQKQELDGLFINIHELPIYYSYDRVRHNVSKQWQKEYPVYVGMDFNVNPMTAICAQQYNYKINVFKEIWIMSSSTTEMGRHLADLFPDKSKVLVIPDSTGRAKKSSSDGESDLTILTGMGFKVVDTHNPARRDRYNCVNNVLEKGWVEIDPGCEHLSEDLEQMGYKEGTDLEDLANPQRGHLSSCLGYLLWYFYPFTKPSHDNFKSIRIR